MATTRVYKEIVAALLDGMRYINSRGGTRSSKTFSALQVLCTLAITDKTPMITSVVSETFPHLRKGAIRDFRSVLLDMKAWDEERWNKGDSTYTFPSGSVIEFFSADSPAKVHGPARDRLFINEGQNIAYETARQLFVRTRGFIIVDYNPTHAFWMHEKIEPRDNCRTIVSTYRDNTHLTREQVAEIESNRDDERWWKVYGLGETGTLEGIIYDFRQIDRLPDPSGLVEVYGLDFGFTNHPTALLRILADPRRRTAYIDEVAYRTGMLNRDIVDEMKRAGVPRRSVEIFADCAEPKSIEEIAQAGFNVKPCYKGKEVTEQVSFIQGWKLHFTKASVSSIREVRGYVWAKDKDGRPLNVPVKINDHAMDALRYALFTKFADFRKPTTGGKPKTSKAW